MKCPHCGKIVLLVKDTNASKSSAPAPAADNGDVGELLDQILDSGLNDWEAGFVTDLRAKYAKYKDRIRVSEKQLAMLRKIAAGKDDDWEPPF